MQNNFLNMMFVFVALALNITGMCFYVITAVVSQGGGFVKQSLAPENGELNRDTRSENIPQ